MKNRFDALLFDMDGVLVDVSDSYRTAIQQTAGLFLKRDVDMAEVKRIKERVGMNNDWDATYALIGDPTVPYLKVKEIFQKIYWGEGEEMGLIKNETLFIPKKTLLLLKAKYGKLGIATGRPRVEALYVLSRFKLDSIFEVLVAKEDSEREKPFPDPLISAKKKIGAISPVYIGDSPSDVMAAESAGMPCIYVGALKMGTVRLETMSQVVEFLL